MGHVHEVWVGHVLVSSTPIEAAEGEPPGPDPVVAAALAELRGRQAAAFAEVVGGGTLSMARLRDAMLAALTVD